MYIEYNPRQKFQASSLHIFNRLDIDSFRNLKENCVLSLVVHSSLGGSPKPFKGIQEGNFVTQLGQFADDRQQPEIAVCAYREQSVLLFWRIKYLYFIEDSRDHKRNIASLEFVFLRNRRPLEVNCAYFISSFYLMLNVYTWIFT